MLCMNYTGKYIGKEICGFKKEHVYDFNLDNNGRTYELYATYDKTDDKDVALAIHYASEISIKRNWEL